MHDGMLCPDPRSRSRSRVLESHSRGVDRQSRTGLILLRVHTDGSSVRVVSVCLSVTIMSPANTTEPI